MPLRKEDKNIVNQQEHNARAGSERAREVLEGNAMCLCPFLGGHCFETRSLLQHLKGSLSETPKHCLVSSSIKYQVERPHIQ